MTLVTKLLELLDPSQRRALAILLGLMLIGMFFETLSVGVVLPALTLLTRQEMPSALPLAQDSVAALADLTSGQVAILGISVLVGVFVLKSLFLAFLAWRQARFVFDLQADISHRLFTGYLYQRYTFHLERNSAQLIRNVVTETNLFAHTGLLATIVLATEVMVLLGICGLLIYIEPLGAVLVGAALGIAGWGFHRLTHEHILRWGEARQHHEGLRIQHLQQGLGGVKDVMLLGREAEFLTQYQEHNLASARVGKLQNVLLQLPRLWLELLAVSGLAILVIVVVAQGNPVDALLPTLGLFAAAAFRLMPSANRMLTAIQHIRFAIPIVNVLHAELQQSSAAQQPARSIPLPFRKMVSLDEVSFKYPSTDKFAIRDITLRIDQGTSVGLVGSSGAGKSTLVDIILGLLRPHAGRVTVDGVDIQSNLRGWQDQIGYVPQTIFVTDDTLRRNIAFGLPDDQIDERGVWRALEMAQLDEFVRDLPAALDTTLGERGIRLSGGQRQRIGIARALYHDPTVLVLDEATSSLDTATERDVMHAVQALHGDKTIVIVAHRYSTVEQCDKLYRVDRGGVVEEGNAGQMSNPNRATS